MHSHIVNVPQDVDLKVNVKWGEGGVETNNMSVEGLAFIKCTKHKDMTNPPLEVGKIRVTLYSE